MNIMYHIVLHRTKLAKPIDLKSQVITDKLLH